MEIERKFTVRKLPDNLDSYPFHIIEQAYLNTDPVVRIRREDDAFYLTYKGKGMMAREEYNLPLNKDSYYHLLEKADGNIISKWAARSLPSNRKLGKLIRNDRVEVMLDADGKGKLLFEAFMLYTCTLMLIL